MKNFAYAQPRTEQEAVQLLSPRAGETAILAGGTDLVGLLKRMVLQPGMVVNIAEIPSLRRIDPWGDGGLSVGASVSLDTFLTSRTADRYPAVKQAIQGINSIQLQSQGTLVGELMRRPNCWYFRNGQGLLGNRGQLVLEGDNRYHAILGNRGPAKFVNASRLAPALISLGTQVRVIGPASADERFLPLEAIYQTPRDESEREHALEPNQLVTHLLIPSDGGRLSAAYEVRQSEGPDHPLAAAAASLEVVSGVVRTARIVLGQVAPTPWISHEAAQSLIGKPINAETAEQAGYEAVASAMPLSQNEYKIQLGKVAVKRAILRAAGLDTGGF